MEFPGDFEEISRAELDGEDDDIVVVVSSKASGVNFLIDNQAWGPVRFLREPQYLALYITSPQSEVKFIGKVRSKEKIDETGIEEELGQYKDVNPGDEIVWLDEVYKLKDSIPLKGGNKGIIREFQYTSLSSFMNAEGTDELETI